METCLRIFAIVSCVVVAASGNKYDRSGESKSINVDNKVIEMF